MVEVVLMRDVYHCTPPELEALSMERILQDLTCIEWETKAQNQRAKTRSRKK
jgi:tRNA A37 threonylcarbamoyladenosine biosynthesis protein TsaE